MLPIFSTHGLLPPRPPSPAQLPGLLGSAVYLDGREEEEMKFGEHIAASPPTAISFPVDSALPGASLVVTP